MTNLDDDAVLRLALMSAREAAPTDSEIRSAIERASARSRWISWPGIPLIALTIAALIGIGSYAAPPTRAAIEDIYGSLASWMQGSDADAPGRPLDPNGTAPLWVKESGGRLIAESNGVGLYVTRTFLPARGGTELSFALGEGTIVGDSIDGWRQRFERHAIVVLGPTPARDGQMLDSRGRFPLLGVTARAVTKVVLRYATGTPTMADGLRGGFVLMADARRRPETVAAYDSAGRELERGDISHIDMRSACAASPACDDEALGGS
jgi:hypothetical protein